MHGALEVPANGHALREPLVALIPQRPPEAGERTVGNHDVAGMDLPLLAGLLVLHHGAGKKAIAQDRPERFGALEQDGATGDRLLRHQRVEVSSAHHVAVARVHGVLGPLHLECLAMGDAAQAVVAVVVGGHLLLETHGLDLGDGARGETVAAGLLPRERLLLDDHHVAAGPRQPVPGGGTGGAAADDEDVVAMEGGHPGILPVECDGETVGRRAARVVKPRLPRFRWPSLSAVGQTSITQ